MLRYHGNVEITVAPDLSTEKQPLLYPTSLAPSQNSHPAAKRSDVYKVVLETLPTNKCLHTKDKTEWRHMYNFARLSAGIQSFQDAKEVLLYNAAGDIMDVSIMRSPTRERTNNSDRIRRALLPLPTSSATANGSLLTTTAVAKSVRHVDTPSITISAP